MKLESFSLRQIIMVSMLPIFLLAVFYTGDLIYEQYTVVQEMDRIKTLAAIAPTISNVVHELQKERGNSAGFIGSKGDSKFKLKLMAQRELTDRKLSKLFGEIKSFPFSEYNDELRETFNVAESELELLASKRRDVEQLKYTIPQMAKYYTGTITKLLTVVEEIGALSSNADITRLINAYTSFLQAKERMGIERAMGAGGFGAGEFKQVIYNRFIGLIAAENAFLDRFKVNAPKDMVKFYNKTVSGAVVDEVNRLRQIIIKYPETKSTEDVEGTYWFDTITQKINLMKIVEDKLAVDLTEHAELIHNKAINILKLNIILGGIILVISTLIVILVTGLVAKSLSEVKGIMEAYSREDYDLKIEEKSICRELKIIYDSLFTFREAGLKKKELELEQEQLIQEQKKAKEREILIQKESQEKLISEAQGHLEGFVAVSLRNNEVITGLAEENVSLDSVAQSTVRMASAVEEMSSTIGDLNEMSSTIAEESLSSANVSEETIKAVDKIVEVMELINSSSEDVSNHVSVLSNVIDEVSNMVSDIAEIAQQTNVLALNATVEAARAGEAGKGFAVVATEVKKLAALTAGVTANISESITKLHSGMGEVTTSISESSSAVVSGKEISQEVNNSVQQVSRSIYSVNNKVDEMSGLLEQQAYAANEINETVSAVSENAVESVFSMKNIFGLLDHTCKTIEERLVVFSNLGTGKSIVELAKNDHSKFKKRILDTILGRDTWRADQVPCHNECRLGKWYFEKASETIRRLPEYKELDSIHNRVHELTREILGKVEDSDTDGAIQGMKELDILSAKVIELLTAISVALSDSE